MKKNLLWAALFALLSSITQRADAQHTFDADLQLLLRDTVTHFTIEAGDSVMVGFAVANHGPDNVDTNGFIFYSMTGIPAGFSLIVQSDSGRLQPLGNGDTILSRGVQFNNSPDNKRDTTYEYCYFLRTSEDPDSFIYDANRLNDTVCFYVTFKKGTDTVMGIGARDRAPMLAIAPNPASTVVNIPVKDLMHTAATLKIYSLDGRTVYQEQLPPDNRESVPVDIRSWNKGMYWVELRSDKVKRQGRFVVQ